MSIITIIKDEDYERQLELSDGTLITLRLDDEIREVTFWDENDKQLSGEFIFEESDGPDNEYLLGRMYAPIKKMGLGSAAIEFFIDHTDADIYTRTNNGQKYNDGSHLTEDAPGFVISMQDKGLILKDEE